MQAVTYPAIIKLRNTAKSKTIHEVETGSTDRDNCRIPHHTITTPHHHTGTHYTTKDQTTHTHRHHTPDQTRPDYHSATHQTRVGRYFDILIYRDISNCDLSSDDLSKLSSCSMIIMILLRNMYIACKILKKSRKYLCISATNILSKSVLTKHRLLLMFFVLVVLHVHNLVFLPQNIG